MRTYGGKGEGRSETRPRGGGRAAGSGPRNFRPAWRGGAGRTAWRGKKTSSATSACRPGLGPWYSKPSLVMDTRRRRMAFHKPLPRADRRAERPRPPRPPKASVSDRASLHRRSRRTRSRSSEPEPDRIAAGGRRLPDLDSVRRRAWLLMF